MPPDEKNSKGAEKDDYFQKVIHYFKLSSPCHLIASGEKLKNAKRITNPGPKNKGQIKRNKNLSEKEKERAKYLYDSAYYPTGETRPFVTRLAAQAPLKMLTLGGMLAYYELTPHIILWQWLHQSLVSYIDYKNRNAPGNNNSVCEVACAYSYSTVGAVATAVSLNKLCKCKPLFRRFGSLAAVAVGSLINTSILKNRHWSEGIAVSNSSGTTAGISKRAGSSAVFNSMLNNLLLTAPPLIVTPLVLHTLEQKNKFCHNPWLEKAYAVGVTGLTIFLFTPFILAAICEKGSIKTELLEDEIKKHKAAAKQPFMYYNRKLI